MDSLGHFHGADCIGNRAFDNASNGNDVPGMRFFQAFAGKAAVGQDFADADAFDFIVFSVKNLDRIVDMQGSGLYFPGKQTSDKFVGFKSGGQHGKGGVDVAVGFADVGTNQLKQRGQVFLFVFHVLDRPAVASRSVQNRKVQLFVIGVETDEQVKDFVQNLVNPGIGLVSLIDDHNRAQADF